MRRALLITLAYVSACDPARVVRFTLLPEPATDSSWTVRAVAIADTLAQRYQMVRQPVVPECRLRSFLAGDTIRGRPIALKLCVNRTQDGVTFGLSEMITSRWGLKGDSVRLELRDMLYSHFGQQAIKAN